MNIYDALVDDSMLTYPSYDTPEDIAAVCNDARKRAVDYCKDASKIPVAQLYQQVPLSSELVKELQTIVDHMIIGEDDYMDNAIIINHLHEALKPINNCLSK